MRTVRLSEITSLLESGARPKAGVTDSPEVPSLGGEQIAADGTIREHKLRFITRDTFKALKTGQVEVGDILIVKDGATTGKTAFFHGLDGFPDVALNEHVFRLKVNAVQASPRFTYWYLRSERGQAEIAKDFRGATVGGISRGFTSKVQIPLPSLSEQKRIAGILDAADALRAKRRESLAQLDTLLQSTFLDMFGDPATNPMGWEMGVIGDLLASVNYGTSKKADVANGTYPILRMGNITYSGGWNFESLKYIDLDEKEIEKHLVHRGQILFNRTNSKELVGKTAVYREDKPMAFAGYLVRGVTNENADPEYIGAFMNTPQIKQFLQGKCKNIVGMANINAKEFQAIPIAVPPVDLQHRFAAIVASVEHQKTRLRVHLAELDTLFASLQSRAFRGDL